LYPKYTIYCTPTGTRTASGYHGSDEEPAPNLRVQRQPFHSCYGPWTHQLAFLPLDA